MQSVYLKRGKEKSIQRKHHWIFSGALKERPTNIQEGELVQLCGSEGETLAFGHYGKKSIALRILTFGKEFNEETFWEQRLKSAADMRQSLQLKETDCYRLVHGEGDGLPGLIIDRYANDFVVQAHSKGMENAFPIIEKNLIGIFGEKIKCHLRSAEKGKKQDEAMEIPIVENGMKLLVDIGRGQKTGFFLDQRDNRQLLKEMSSAKKVLNMFSYTGGFSVAAMLGGASSVTSVDLSAPAIEMCSRNMSLNEERLKLTHKEIVMDAFEFLSNENLEYNVIVLDPPAFAKHLSAKKNALRAYERLNRLALEKCQKGTTIFTYSCSQVVSKQDFRYAILNAAWESGRSVRILKELGQSLDHPVNLFHPETDYLKGLLLYVE